MIANSKAKKPDLETKPQNGLATIFKLMVASLPLYPAIRINLDAAQGQGETWAIVAIAFVIFGAVCIEHAVHFLRDRQLASAALWGFLGAGFLALNVMNALANAASHSDHSRDHFRDQMRASATIFEQKTKWSHGRDEQAKIAGEATPASIEAQLQAAIAADAKRWQASDKCNPDLIGQPLTRAFCEHVHELQAKKAAAVKRDELDARIAKLDDETKSGKAEAPSSIDPFADAMADGLAAFGYQVDERGKLSITRARDWGKAFGVELLAGFGPTALLLLFLRAGSSQRREEPQPKAQALVRQKQPVEAPVRPVALTAVPQATIAHFPAPDPLQSFVARRIERCEGAAVAAGDLWRLWLEDCEAHGIEPGTQQAFGRAMKKRLAHEKNNGRPRYLGVRPKVEHAPLRLAVVNS
jgi:hypothetical protein